MSETVADVHGGVLEDPSLLLAADRAAVRAYLAEADEPGGVGREVFLQAEGIFGGAEVSRAEFAAWLHFAAKATGHEEYAERIAAAEPRMPWRTVWAWWRPVNWFVAQPSLNGDYYTVEIRPYEGRELVRVGDQRGLWWFDADTGARVRIPDERAVTGASRSPEALVVPRLREWDLTAPYGWKAAHVLAAEGGRARHLVADVNGMAVLETDVEVLRDWPRGDGIDTTSADKAPPGPAPATRRPTGPLTAERVDDAFGQQWVLRIPEDELPESLEHADSRRYLRDIGVPTWWGCHTAEYKAVAPDAMKPPADGSVTGGDLLALGSWSYGDLYLHRLDGSVHIASTIDSEQHPTMVRLAPGLDVFIRALEAVYRYANACWHPYPTEGDQEAVTQVYLAEMAELAPGLFDPATPSGYVWSWIYAGITELGVDGF
ncbi:SUKH-4 family immunity protein [Streptomyces sp. T-3]|nr:SUKH-4 family immunity protein [Streptomyces sp. T-3]